MTRIKALKEKTSKKKKHEVESSLQPATRLSASPSGHFGPRKHPRQSRAKDTVAAILEAAAEVFAEKGYSGATTNKIALRAGVSIGSLYQYFPNKDAILAGLRERHLSDVHVVIERSMLELADDTLPIHRALGSLIRGLIDLHGENPKLTRALSNEVIPPHLVDEEHGKKEAELYARETERILSRRSGVRYGNSAMMAHILVQTTEALTRWYVHEAPSILDKEAYVEETLRLLTGYILEK